MFWRSDPAVEAARKLAGWAEFHRECGKHWLYFDHIEREGRRSEYTAPAFTLPGRQSTAAPVIVSTGKGKTPILALVDAYHSSGFRVPEAEPWLALLVTPQPAQEPAAISDFDDLLGGNDLVNFEDLLG